MPSTPANSDTVKERSTEDLQWNKLSPKDLQQLKDSVARSENNLEEVLSEFEDNGRFSRYNRNGEVDLDGFTAFITSYLEADTPEELIKHLFFSFVKKKPTQPQRQEEEADEPVSETASKDGTPQEDEKADDSFSLGSGISEDHFDISLEELTERFRALKYGGSSEEWTDSDATSKQVCSALMWSTKSLSFQGSEEGTAVEMTTMSVKPPLLFVDERGGFAAVPTSEEKEGVEETSLIKAENVDTGVQLVSLKDIARYFSLLKAGKPRDKLEFLFHLYDADGNGVLDKDEIQCVQNQMMNVAEHVGWDTEEIKSVLRDTLVELDYDGDGTVSLEEWIRGGLTSLPLLVLLGLDSNTVEDGKHVWRLKVFKKPASCNICFSILFGFGSKGFTCILCKFVAHERCLPRSTDNCITTYSKEKSTGRPMAHHWVEGNCRGKCFLCETEVGSCLGTSGLRCRWCQIILHNECASEVSPVCTLGPNRVHIIPPTAIYPAVLDKDRRTAKEVKMSVLPSQPTTFRIEPPPDTRPLLVFINPKSGGLQGAEIKRKFQYSLNPKQVYDLMQDDPMQALQLFKDVQNLRVICCGGDGTVGWVLDMIDKSNFASHPIIGVVPLGTGNDLARCLQWGGGYEGEPISTLLEKIEHASMVVLDRWNVEIIADSPTDRKPGSGHRTTKVLTNYFSVGVDAAICIRFHFQRGKYPGRFNSRMRNKLWYLEFATSETFSASCRNLHQDVELECDGMLFDLASGQPIQGIAVLSIPSTHGGTQFWGDGSGIGGLYDEWKERFDRFRRHRRNEDTDSLPKIDLSKTMQDVGDGLFEVVGLESCLHMGQVRAGLRASGRKIAQCSSLTMRTKRRLPMQIDGEPWMQNPGTIKISHRCQVPMLKAPNSNEGCNMCCVLM